MATYRRAPIGRHPVLYSLYRLQLGDTLESPDGRGLLDRLAGPDKEDPALLREIIELMEEKLGKNAAMVHEQRQLMDIMADTRAVLERLMEVREDEFVEESRELAEELYEMKNCFIEKKCKVWRLEAILDPRDARADPAELEGVDWSWTRAKTEDYAREYPGSIVEAEDIERTYHLENVPDDIVEEWLEKRRNDARASKRRSTLRSSTFGREKPRPMRKTKLR